MAARNPIVSWRTVVRMAGTTVVHKAGSTSPKGRTLRRASKLGDIQAATMKRGVPDCHEPLGNNSDDTIGLCLLSPVRTFAVLQIRHKLWF